MWADYKCGLKKKLAHNNREYRSTGGGPCDLKSLSAFDKHAITILSLNSVVEGTPYVPARGRTVRAVEGIEPQPSTSRQQTSPQSSEEVQILAQQQQQQKNHNNHNKTSIVNNNNNH